MGNEKTLDFPYVIFQFSFVIQIAGSMPTVSFALSKSNGNRFWRQMRNEK